MNEKNKFYKSVLLLSSEGEEMLWNISDVIQWVTSFCSDKAVAF